MKLRKEISILGREVWAQMFFASFSGEGLEMRG